MTFSQGAQIMMRLKIHFSQDRFHSVLENRERKEKKRERATLNALRHMNIAIINSELWLGPSVSLNGPIRVNHCCLQASLGTH